MRHLLLNIGEKDFHIGKTLSTLMCSICWNTSYDIKTVEFYTPISAYLNLFDVKLFEESIGLTMPQPAAIM